MNIDKKILVGGLIASVVGLFLWITRAEAKVASLTGTVRDATTSTTLKGVLVKLNSMTFTTDASGYYVFENVAAGKRQLVAQKAGYKEATMTIELQEGTNTVDVNLVPVAVPEASVTFTVVDSVTSAPIAGVTVTLATTSLITGSDGKCQFTGIIEGDYPISFVKEGYETYQDTVIFYPPPEPTPAPDNYVPPVG